MKMKNIKEIVKSVENGSIDIVEDHEYETKEYVDGATEHYEVHKVEGHENIEVWFPEHDHIQAMRENGAQAELDDTLENANEPADIFNYDKIAAVRGEDNTLEWL